MGFWDWYDRTSYGSDTLGISMTEFHMDPAPSLCAKSKISSRINELLLLIY